MSPSPHFYRLVQCIHIKKVRKVPCERAIRLYCESFNLSWNLQIRSPISISHGKVGKDFIVATATLTREEMEALRDAINESLAAGQK